jgi:prepilin-type N-terminal cleavage/methylation domain-containing protein
MNRRGFTALELMMATAIGAVVLMAALGVFGMMERLDRFHAQRFRESSDQVFAHTVLERAMQTLVAQAEADPERIIEGSTGINPDDAELETPRGPDDGNAELRRAQREGAVIPGLHGQHGEFKVQPKGKVFDEFNREIKARPMFVLEAAGVLASDNSAAPRRLEVTMLAQPAPGAPKTPLFVRGAFEAVPVNKGWALVYVPIAPAGEPITLLEGIRDMRWELLVRGQSSSSGMLKARDEEDMDKGGVRVAELNANVARQFPKAIRFLALLSTGQTVDWMFEPSVTTAGVYNLEAPTQ